MQDDEVQEPTPTHDLSGLEDDPTEPSMAPAPKRLVMSRELRGWIAGLSAFVVAAAAIMPLVDITELRGSINTKDLDAAGIAGELTCQAQDQTGGIGGQKVGCTFTCPDNPGTVSVYVDADDSDAQVSGDATCGTDNAHCSGKNMCDKTEERTGTGTGTCKADSDEAVDSGLYVECTAEVDEVVDPYTPGSEVCPVTEPTPVCVQPVCAMFPKLKAETCQTVWQAMVDSLTPTTVIVAFIAGEDGAGLACEGTICVPFEPICVATKDGGRTCFAP